MLENKTIALTAFFLFGLIIIGKLVAFVKDIAVSAYFGVSAITDAYFLASSIPSLLLTAFYSTIALVFLPIYNKKLSINGSSIADKFASTVINIYVLISAILSFLGIYFAFEIVSFMAPTFSGETKSLAVDLTQILCTSFVFSIVASIFSTIQYVKKEFYGPQLIPVINNTLVIVSIVIFTPYFGIYIVAISSVFGWILQVYIQKKLLGTKFNYSFQLKDESLKKMSLLFIPVFISVSIDQINILVDIMLGSALSEGSISALNYSSRLMNFASGIFVMLVSTIVYTIFSDHIVKNDFIALQATLTQTLKLLLLIMVPLTTIAIMFHYEIVSIVFKRGLFNETDVLLTSKIFIFYAIGILFIVFRETLNRVFYSMEDTMSPLIASIISIIINIILSIVLVNYMGVSGLALATSFSIFVYIIIQIFWLKKKIGDSFYKGLTPFIIKIFFAVLFMSGNIYLYKEYTSFEIIFIDFVLGAIVGLSSYLMILFFLKLEELKIILNLSLYFYKKIRSKYKHVG